MEIAVVIEILPLDSSIPKDSLISQRRNLKTVEVLDDTEQILDLALNHSRWDQDRTLHPKCQTSLLSYLHLRQRSFGGVKD